jgi:hypothetical protein
MQRAALLLALAPLAAAPAAAQSPALAGADTGWSVERLEHDVLGAEPASAHRLRADPPRDGEPDAGAPDPPVRRRLGVFANGMRFRVLQHDGGLDLRGGAYLRLLDNLTLQGSYRVFDYDRVEGDSSSEKDDHGPLFGLRLNF